MNNTELLWYARRVLLASKLEVKDLYSRFGKVIHKDDMQGVADAMRLEASFVVKNFFTPLVTL